MIVTIIQKDSVVGVDGIFRQVDMKDLDPTIHAVQFSTIKGRGHVEFSPDVEPRQGNLDIIDLSPYQVYVDRWTAAAPPSPLPPPPPPPPSPPVDRSDLDKIDKQIKAVILAAALMSGKTQAQAKTAYKQAWDSLP